MIDNEIVSIGLVESLAYPQSLRAEDIRPAFAVGPTHLIRPFQLLYSMPAGYVGEKSSMKTFQLFVHTKQYVLFDGSSFYVYCILIFSFDLRNFVFVCLV